MSDPEASHSAPSAPAPGSTPPPRTTGGNWRWEPPSAEELQQLMPGYTIEKILGRGGMGAVYRGLQTNLDRPVAIKILPPGVAEEDPSFAERFRSEAKLMAKLNHPAVVAVYDFGTTLGGQLYFAMEYVDGSDVSQMIAAQGKLLPEHALAITAHVCDALQAAHDLGIVHRDIKPANVLLNMKGQVKVADFGLAKVEEPGQHGLTKAGFAMGTPNFVAPEALMLGVVMDGRADLYAVGVMLYQMLTGIIPRGAFKPASALVLGLDPRFDLIITKAMQHDRADRHQSPAELRRELDVILTVPFVRNDAPVSAAIPVAHVAQIHGQRSGAQKPVRKSPQPRSADVPGRQPTSGKAGEGTRSPGAPAKSKTPFFIGLGAAASIGITAFVMLGGGEKAQQKGSRASSGGAQLGPSSVKEARPSKPVSDAPERRVSSATPAATKPAVPLRNQDGAASNAAPQWRKTDFANLGKKASGKNRIENGFLYVTNHEGWNPEGPGEIWRNGAIRTTLLWEGPNKTKGPQIHIRGLGGHGSYFVRPTDRELQVLFGKTGQAERMLAKFPIEPPFKPDSEVSVRIAAIGKKLILWANGRHLGSLDDEMQTRPGTPYLSAEATRFKSIEVINLDGLPETEALMMLGVEAHGRDLRQPAPTVAGTNVPPSFPTGQWVKILPPGSDLPEGARWENKWLVTNGAMLPVLVRPAKASFTNTAIRAVLKKDPSGGKGIIGIRHQDKGGKENFRAVQVPNVQSNPVEIGIQTSVNGSQALQVLAKASVESGEGEFLALEFGAVGSRVFLRINGKRVASAQDEKPQAGDILLSQFKGRIRDLEVINLDGLPEAEALKILGVDGKGNDLPVLAAKQEEMQKALAAQAEAMAAIPELKALHEQFLRLQTERVTAPFEADVAKLNTGYLGGLDRKIGEMKQKGDLDSVLALEAEKALVAGKQPVPAIDENPLPALQDLRQIYWDAHGKLEANRAANLNLLIDPLDTRLKQLESTLTQQNRIEHAKAVREYREDLIQEKRADIASGPAQPAGNASNGGAAATMTETGNSSLVPPKNLPPGDDRKAAEWALDMGGEVFVLEVRDRRRIQAKADLPKRSFDLVSISIDSERTTKPVIPFTGLSALAGLKHLSFLEVRGYPVRDDDTDYLATLPNLTHLQITDCKTFSGKKLSMLKKAEKLEILNLRSTDKVSADGIAQIGQLSELKNLNLSASKLADSDLPPLRQLKKLEGLSVTGPEITLAGWRELKGLPLKSCGFSSPPGKFAEWCREIGSLFPTINHSYMWSGQPFPAGEIAALKGFGGLEELIISSVHTDDATLAEVLDFPKLNKLVINNGGSADLAKKVTDEGIARLAKLRSLKTLRLENLGEVTGEGLIGLRQLENLELPLRSCPKFKEAAFRNARPDVKISR